MFNIPLFLSQSPQLDPQLPDIIGNQSLGVIGVIVTTIGGFFTTLITVYVPYRQSIEEAKIKKATENTRKRSNDLAKIEEALTLHKEALRFSQSQQDDLERLLVSIQSEVSSALNMTTASYVHPKELPGLISELNTLNDPRIDKIVQEFQEQNWQLRNCQACLSSILEKTKHDI